MAICGWEHKDCGYNVVCEELYGVYSGDKDSLIRCRIVAVVVDGSEVRDDSVDVLATLSLAALPNVSARCTLAQALQRSANAAATTPDLPNQAILVSCISNPPTKVYSICKRMQRWMQATTLI